MSKYERLMHAILSRAKNAGWSGYYVRPWSLGGEFGIQTMHVREKLLELAQEGFILLDAWGKDDFRPFNAWPTTDELFKAGNQAAGVRIRILAAGDEYLEQLHEINHRRIGFQASA